MKVFIMVADQGHLLEWGFVFNKGEKSLVGAYPLP